MSRLDNVYQDSITHFLDNVEDLNIAMPMYNLLEYSDNYSMTSGSFWNYYRDEVNDNVNENKWQVNLLNIRQKQKGTYLLIIIH